MRYCSVKHAIPLLLALVLVLPAVSPGARAAVEEGDSGLLWLVNYDHPIDAGYVPQGLQGAAGGLRGDAYAAFEAMMADMKAAGHWAWLTSGYRSYSVQSGLFQRRLNARLSAGQSYDKAYSATRRYTAPPGTSEHQLGLAADVTADGSLTARFAGTGAGQWLYAHCAQYGFVRRYDGTKEGLTQIADEAWHFRYVGLPHARIMAESNFCLEEYVAYLRDNGTLIWQDQSGALYRVCWYADRPQTDSAYATDCSRDNLGGWIVTEALPDRAAGTPESAALIPDWARPALRQSSSMLWDQPYTWSMMSISNFLRRA